MLTRDLDYDLPEELIAQRPAEPRDASRLMVVDVASGSISHHGFRELPGFLLPDDRLVLNETRVVPARVQARKATGGEVELLFLRETGEGNGRRRGIWEVLARPGRRLRPGLVLSAGDREVEVVERLDGGRWLVGVEDAPALMRETGHLPLPPDIRPTTEAEAAYQTVYAERPGSVAAPTAGLHFTDGVLEAVEARGVGVSRVTLDVGMGTFSPVRSETVEEHGIHAERYRVPEATARAVGEADRVVAVGTTVARTLESWAATGLREGESSLFIYPGYRWRTVDTLLTNLHAPRSTLLAMVMSFAGEALIRTAYRTAVEERYRFHSFGDAMLLVGGGRSVRGPR
ncbi:MAG: tRNA preQ1(34) S-adenosylmethionine ribosyltransferase-isomerase QueA [Rubrobacter sp.]|nr:tRNA preQ1(34) S-adenosylmethionine ribosyltransferase-isomerase QueA [Rubrobacter sp.]